MTVKELKAKSYRNLNTDEINYLLLRGCTATDWSTVYVHPDFDTEKLLNVHFSGTVKIGHLEGTFERQGGLVRYSSLTDVTFHNVTIGDGVCIRKVANYIANYDIGDHVYIDNIDCLVSTLTSTYGIGTEVSVLNETGGREVPIYEKISAQTAYLIAMYRHNDEVVNRLSSMIEKHAASQKGLCGKVGEWCEITNCGTITDVNIGSHSMVKGATRLKNGTISESCNDPVFVGRDVIAENFIFASGSRVEDGAVVRNCFVGQASALSHLFSAHDSLFFANCNCENGEAAAIFGGPYTVTMHKSSLLIAGLFSFLNAGSGSNQSNHMYKLGPIHQGIVERGSKTTSDSYILWPARIGAFSLVMGRHVNHPDTSRLPFSYLIENKNESFLVPGVNLRSVGTIRDAQKWPKRDKRKDSHHLDNINFNLLSPYTVGKMMDGINLLNALERTAGITAERYSFQAMTIESRALRKGREYYSMAIDKFMGNSLISRLGNKSASNDQELHEILKPTHNHGRGEWIDVCGMFAPRSVVEEISGKICADKSLDLESLENLWHTVHKDYYDMEWTWVADNFKKWYGKEIQELTLNDIRDMVNRWLSSVMKLNHLLLEDAQKEFSLKSRTGFGIDNPMEEAEKDFCNVRGDFESDPFVCMVKEHIKSKSKLAEETIARLNL